MKPMLLKTSEYMKGVVATIVAKSVSNFLGFTALFSEARNVWKQI